MRNVLLVKPEDADLARRMESKLIALPMSSGILFAGVSVRPASDAPIYCVWIGCHRDFDEKLMDPLVRGTLAGEIQDGAHIVIEAHRGLSRSPIKIVDK